MPSVPAAPGRRRGHRRVLGELALVLPVTAALLVSSVSMSLEPTRGGPAAPSRPDPVVAGPPVPAQAVGGRTPPGPGRYEVAVAQVPEVAVQRARPADVVLDGRELERVERARQLEPRRHELSGFSGAIPGPGRNVAGRIGEAWGWRLTNPSPEGHPVVLPVVAVHGQWLEVLLPVRPNGTTGWVRADSFHLQERSVTARIELSARRLVVLDAGREVWSTPVGVGAPDTPTPTGRFFVTGAVDTGDTAGPYGPTILGLSGFSEALDSFDGGAPGVAVHGTNRPASIGQAASNGCIRVPNGALGALSFLLGPGSVVDIHP